MTRAPELTEGTPVLYSDHKGRVLAGEIVAGPIFDVCGRPVWDVRTRDGLFWGLLDQFEIAEEQPDDESGDW